MAKSLSGIEAGLLEARGEGAFILTGRVIRFRSGAMEWSWNCRTEADAASQLRIFRVAPKYMVAA